MNKITNGLLSLIVLMLLTVTNDNKTHAADATPLLIAVFGDSLSSGYGLETSEGFAPVLQRALDKRGLKAKVMNAAIAGETSADALARVGWMLTEKPDIVLVEFGANDMLRGIDPAVIYKNMNEVLERIHASGARVLLAGMLAPKNLGEDYGQRFRQMYEKLREQHKVAFYPFFLEGVALSPQLVLPDGMHPNAKGVRRIVLNITPLVEKLLRQ